MINQAELRHKIDKSGKSITFLASKLNMTREGLYKKLKGQTEFKASEIMALRNELSLSAEEVDTIFFTHGVN